jgi:hypothetical protein
MKEDTKPTFKYYKIRQVCFLYPSNTKWEKVRAPNRQKAFESFYKKQLHDEKVTKYSDHWLVCSGYHPLYYIEAKEYEPFIKALVRFLKYFRKKFLKLNFINIF